MENAKALIKISKLYLTKKYTNLADISNSYTRISAGYDNSFLNEMHQYNEIMLDELLNKINSNAKDEISILDLACGTGFNSQYLNARLHSKDFTLVDISTGMLNKARVLGDESWTYIESDMLSYLRSCKDDSFDVVVCAWAIKYQNPHKIIKEISRVLKKGGHVAVIVNLKGTLPEIRSIYPQIIKEHYKDVNKVMLELPNPLSERTFKRWFSSKDFNTIALKSGNHKFTFDSYEKLVEWVTSTGALAGFDTMVNMEDKEVQKTMGRLLNKKNICSITHKFVWGVFQNEK